MKRLILILILLLLIPIIGIAQKTTIPLDTIVATVNNQIITEQNLQENIKQAKMELQSEHKPIPNEKTLRHKILNQLIDQTLQLQLAKKMSIQISDTQLNETIKNIAKRNKLTVSQLRQAIIEQGTSYKAYRKQIRNQMIINQLQEQVVTRNITVSNEEIANFLQNYKQQKHPDTEYHLLDILVPLNDPPSSQKVAQAKKQAQDIYMQLKKNVKFEKTKNVNSTDLGWRKLTDLPSIFAERTKTMNKGQAAGPLRAPNGFHVIKLIGIRNNNQNLTKAQAKQIIFQRKFQQNLQGWLQQLRDSAYINVNNG